MSKSAVKVNRCFLIAGVLCILFYLIENKNIALSRDKLLSDIWGYDFFGDDRTIDTHIKNLRNNLGEYRKFIVTLRGVGYKFEFED